MLSNQLLGPTDTHSGALEEYVKSMDEGEKSLLPKYAKLFSKSKVSNKNSCQGNVPSAPMHGTTSESVLELHSNLPSAIEDFW